MGASSSDPVQPQTRTRTWRHSPPELLDALKDAMKLIDVLFPGVKHLAIQDYAMLNDVPLKIRDVLSRAPKE